VTPEAAARVAIDAQLAAAGWVVQDRDAANPKAGLGVAIREFPLAAGHGFADYLLYVDGKAAGVVEAKPEGTPLSGVEIQTGRYAQGLPAYLPAVARPLPFLYEATGEECRFTNLLDPEPRSRRVFHFHTPEELADWLGPPPSTLRGRLAGLPPVGGEKLWAAQRRAVENLERSLAEQRPRSLIQMATGSGKTFAAITAAYRLIKHADARRVLFLVDRANLGRQALKEFQLYRTPDDGRAFTDLYNVQHLTSNKIDPVARVVITTIQRLYSMLQGEEAVDEEREEHSLAALEGVLQEPVPVAYRRDLPVGFFDVVFIDECHRSIYTLWRQVVEYFDAFLVGLTATPSRQTFGFFERNLVMEYGHPQAVADRVNVDFEVYRIRTRISEEGSQVEAGAWVGKRDRRRRVPRWERLDDELTYGASALDRAVVARDQIRTVIRTFRDRLPEIFPGRTHVPKTLIFAKDDSHAEDVVEIVRQEFAKGNDFAQKITYRTTGAKPEDLIQAFRTAYDPRIAVTVDMIATGTDVKPLEIVMFLRAVKSRNFFEQMKGRGVRVIDRNDLVAVTPDATVKDHFVIVDCVGVTETDLSDTQPLERKRSVGFGKLLETVTFGNRDADVISSLGSRLARLDLRLGDAERGELTGLAGGLAPRHLAAALLDALDPDRQAEQARRTAVAGPDFEPTPEQLDAAEAALIEEAVEPLVTRAELRARLVEIKRASEQVIDEVSQDQILDAGFSRDSADRARTLVTSWREFIEENRDQITALQVLYSRPYRHRLSFAEVKELAYAIEAPPRRWTIETLWNAYDQLEHDRVRGASAQHLLTDIVSLVRFALEQDDELVPYQSRVDERFASWLAQQEQGGKRFSDEQRRWLGWIKKHVAANVRIEVEDFEYAPFAQRGGVGKAYEVFGEGLGVMLEELNEELAA